MNVLSELANIEYDIYEASFDFKPPSDGQSQQPPAGQADTGTADYSVLKKYTLYLKLKELLSYVSKYSNNLGDDEAKKRELDDILYFINVVINFFDIFDYPAIKILSKEILDNIESVIRNQSKTLKPQGDT